ncbi:MAG: hypothetical protein ACLTPC_15200 [Lacrimispora saccharolytica]
MVAGFLWDKFVVVYLKGIDVWIAGVCQVFCVSFLEKILWGGEPPLCRTGRFKAASY